MTAASRIVHFTSSPHRNSAMTAVKLHTDVETRTELAVWLTGGVWVYIPHREDNRALLYRVESALRLSLDCLPKMKINVCVYIIVTASDNNSWLIYLCDFDST
jgi:hypothetical protein